MENTEQLTPDAKYILNKADILIGKIEKRVKFDMVDLSDYVDWEKVRESKNRYDGVGELMNDEFVSLLKERKI